jgi:hypothetical protein
MRDDELAAALLTMDECGLTDEQAEVILAAELEEEWLGGVAGKVEGDSFITLGEENMEQAKV